MLIDFDRYPEWNPFTPVIQTSLVPGTPVDIEVVLWFRQHQREVLEEAVAPQRLVWGMVMGTRWLLWARRVQRLDPVASGTRYETVDTIGGLLSPLVELLFGARLRNGFAAMATSLDEQVTR